jgi:hypothetical protein
MDGTKHATGRELVSNASHRNGEQTCLVRRTETQPGTTQAKPETWSSLMGTKTVLSFCSHRLSSSLRMTGLGLRTPASGQDSPGSSVFDLPTQPTRPSFFSSQPPFSASALDSNDLCPSFLVISGGTGGNTICSAFGNTATYVLPVSDDGGSSSEIIRVLGGPSMGV